MGKKEAKADEKEKKAEGEKKHSSGKEADGPVTVVLKVEMHCEGCAQKVRRSVKGFKGVEAVSSDVSGSKLTVIGKVDPLELRGHVENKTHKKVDLVSPAVAVKKEESSKAEGKEGADAQNPDKDKDQKKADDKKPKESLATSVVLKVRLHCEGCTQRIRKQIYKIKGVDRVSIDFEKDLVTVNGTMEVNSLPEFLTAKLKRGVEIVNQKKDGDGGKEKGEKKKSNEDVGKEGQEAMKTAAVAAAAAETAATASTATTMEASKAEHYGSGYGNYPYRIEMFHAPQLFSDENPNACSIM